MVVAAQTPVTVLDGRRTDWVRQYRRDQAAADLWAKGLRHVSHSLQTQERVFRMTEQLERQGVDRHDVFTALEEADRCVALSDNPHAAAEAGHRAISTLVALLPESLVICAEEDGSSLRAQGFDPLTFDGHDPAAYAWVVFELSKRAEADRRSNLAPLRATGALDTHGDWARPPIAIRSQDLGPGHPRSSHHEVRTIGPEALRAPAPG